MTTKDGKSVCDLIIKIGELMQENEQLVEENKKLKIENKKMKEIYGLQFDGSKELYNTFGVTRI
jgi:regulator of replication initiation timing